MVKNGVYLYKLYNGRDMGFMYCLKCGNETENEQVFCRRCLDIMEQYPVKPGTIARIPHRSTNPAMKKQTRRKVLNADEQVIRLRVVVRTLLAILGAVLIVLGIFVWLYLDLVNKQSEIPESSKGTNYQVVEQDD